GRKLGALQLGFGRLEEDRVILEFAPWTGLGANQRVHRSRLPRAETDAERAVGDPLGNGYFALRPSRKMQCAIVFQGRGMHDGSQRSRRSPNGCSDKRLKV